MSDPARIALAFSGGLDTSVMIPWLRENCGAEVVAVVADVGREEDFEAVRRRAGRPSRPERPGRPSRSCGRGSTGGSRPPWSGRTGTAA